MPFYGTIIPGSLCPGCGENKVTNFCKWWCQWAKIHGRPDYDPIVRKKVVYE